MESLWVKGRICLVLRDVRSIFSFWTFTSAEFAGLVESIDRASDLHLDYDHVEIFRTLQHNRTSNVEHQPIKKCFKYTINHKQLKLRNYGRYLKQAKHIVQRRK